MGISPGLESCIPSLQWPNELEALPIIGELVASMAVEGDPNRQCRCGMRESRRLGSEGRLQCYMQFKLNGELWNLFQEAGRGIN